MTSLAAALGRALQALQQAGNPEARLEAEVLLMHVLHAPRTYLYSRWSEDLGARCEARYCDLLRRRESGEPLAYITGHREFFGLDFHVDKRVLIPRPETELLVEYALSWLKARCAAGTRIADIGTGSGAIAVSLAAGCPEVSVYAADISPGALEVARKNAGAHGLAGRITFLQGDLASPLPEPVDLLLANLPYVKESALPRWCGAAQLELAWEPDLALNGGQDGLAPIRRLVSSAPVHLRPEGMLLLEIGCDQASEVAAVCRAYFPTADIETHRDLAGLPRMVSVRLPGGSR